MSLSHFSETASAPGKNSPVIDLTAEDDGDELTRALKASLEPIQNEIQFGPSQRPSDAAPNWDPANWTVVASDACLLTHTEAVYLLNSRRRAKQDHPCRKMTKRWTVQFRKVYKAATTTSLKKSSRRKQSKI